jgi:hypothetical protein
VRISNVGQHANEIDQADKDDYHLEHIHEWLRNWEHRKQPEDDSDNEREHEQRDEKTDHLEPPGIIRELGTTVLDACTGAVEGSGGTVAATVVVVVLERVLFGGRSFA